MTNGLCTCVVPGHGQLSLAASEAHILPFLWMHGEDRVTIESYLQALAHAGAGEVCLESRPFMGFLEDPWWEELDFIVERAEQLGLRLWILDDEHFPTGYAAGAIASEHPKLAKQFLQCRTVEVVGPQSGAHINVRWLFDERPDVMAVGVEDNVTVAPVASCHDVLGVYVARSIDYGEIDLASLRCVGDLVRDGELVWDVPAGTWSVIGISSTYHGGEEATAGYLNPLVSEATDVLLETVYEPHYRRYANRFGTTVRGFFSDEPRFGNIKGPDAVMGTPGMALPWRDGLEHELAKAWGVSAPETIVRLPRLFLGGTNETHAERFGYMDVVSRLFSENFSARIGAWCAARGVEHIGHVLEDNNAHARLGYGPGHYFRSMAGQGMAGVDIVLHQLMPGLDSRKFPSYTRTGWDGEFFTYCLAKLGSSCAELDEGMHGRSLAEVFGAYGWAEGLRLMKWEADHLLSRGINHFVPHAFSMKPFPDTDCPPHLFAGGADPEFFALPELFGYIEQMATVLSGGRHVSSVALLYHAEAEWSGDRMLVQVPARILTQEQVEFDIVSLDMLYGAVMGTGVFEVTGHEFSALVVPYAERLPRAGLERIAGLAYAGVQVVFVDGYPREVSEDVAVAGSSVAAESAGEAFGGEDALAFLQRTCACVSTLDLTSALIAALPGLDHLVTKEPCPWLRFYHYQQDGRDIIMLFNEDYRTAHVARVRIPSCEDLMVWRPLDGTIDDSLAPGTMLDLAFEAGEAVLLVPAGFVRAPRTPRLGMERWDLTNGTWTVIARDVSDGYERAVVHGAGLPKVDNVAGLERFAGTLCYATTWCAECECVELAVEDANEVVTVRIGDTVSRPRIAPPYRFAFRGLEVGKEYEIAIEVTNNLGRRQRDYLSHYIPLDSLGIRGRVELHELEVRDDC